MYVCEECGKNSEKGCKQHSIILEKRQVEYPPRKKANPIRVDGKREATDDSGGLGWEIKKEIGVCENCYQNLKEKFTAG